MMNFNSSGMSSLLAYVLGPEIISCVIINCFEFIRSTYVITAIHVWEFFIDAFMKLINILALAP